MRKISFSIVLASTIISTAASAGISDNTKISKGDSLLLGGKQTGSINVDGQNRGDSIVELSLLNDDGDKAVVTVLPGKGFSQYVPKNRTLIVRNLSETEAAKVYWHISRYSKSANPRFLSEEK